MQSGRNTNNNIQYCIIQQYTIFQGYTNKLVELRTFKSYPELYGLLMSK